MKKIGSLVTFSLALGGAACGDDSPRTPAPSDPVDANGDFVLGPDSPEGGEVRLEYVDLTPEAGLDERDTGTRVTAFFIRSMTPDHFPAPAAGRCVDLSADQSWPTAQAEDADYIDVGEVTISGGPETLVVPEGTATADPLGRVHARDGVAEPWRFSFGTDDTETYITPDTSYTVTLGGSSEWPTQTFTDALTMPADFDFIAPAAEAFELTPDQPIEITWEVATTTSLGEGESVIGLVDVLVPGQGPVVACAQDPDTGSVTIPAELVNRVISFGAAGTIARQTVVHRRLELSNEDDVKGRRLDLIGVWSHVTPWTATD
jgi:uncharacterized protein YaiE (UPF0345 family)